MVGSVWPSDPSKPVFQADDVTGSGPPTWGATWVWCWLEDFIYFLTNINNRCF